MYRSILASLIIVLWGFVQASAEVPDISLNYISKSACRVSAGPNRGSGVAIAIDSNFVYVLTNAHVVDKYSTVNVEFYRYGAKTNPLKSNVNGRVINQDQDFAILSVPRNGFGDSLPEIIPLAPPTYQIKPNTYFATAGHPFSRDMTAREGRILREEGSRIIFTPPPDSGQSGSGMFVKIADKVYVVGIITFKSGDYSMDMNGYPTTYGAAFNINQLRANLQKTSEYNEILYPVVEVLYARGSNGIYYPQDSSGGVNVPIGVQIVQWNCPSGTCRPSPNEMVPLPRPIIPRPKIQTPQPQTTAPPAINNDGPFQNLPEGFGDPPKVELPVETPKVDTPLPDNSVVPNLELDKLKSQFDSLVNELATLKTTLTDKEATITSLQKSIDEQKLPQLDLEICKKEIADLKLSIEQKNKDIQTLKDFIEAPEEPKIIAPEDTAPTTIIPPTNELPKPGVLVPIDKPETITSTESMWGKIKDTAVNLNPLWAILLGVGGTLLLGKYKTIAAVPGLIIGMVKKAKTADSVIKSNPQYGEIIKWLDTKLTQNDSKLSAITDYMKSKVDNTSNNITNNINVDNTPNDIKPPAFDYKDACSGKPVSDRIKGFFDLKKRDGESIEKWAMFAILYREALQILRKGGFEIDIVGHKVPLQGQRIAADKIDGWVRDQFLKQTTIEKLDYNYLYHEAMIGFLYKEAVRLLRTGFFPILGAKETSEVIENWVRQEFLDRMGITL
jgi:hypothetical protein